MSILNTADNQYHFDVIDGWGGNLDNGGAIAETFKPAAAHQYAASGTSPLKRGSIVKSNHDGTLPTVDIPLVDAAVNLDSDKQRPNLFWMVIEGNTEYDYSSRLGNRVVCLRGAFTIETAHIKGSPSIGAGVTVEHGSAGTADALNPHESTGGGAPGINEGRLVTAASGDPILGRVTATKDVDGTTVYTIEMQL